MVKETAIGLAAILLVGSTAARTGLAAGSRIWSAFSWSVAATISFVSTAKPARCRFEEKTATSSAAGADERAAYDNELDPALRRMTALEKTVAENGGASAAHRRRSRPLHHYHGADDAQLHGCGKAIQDNRRRQEGSTEDLSAIRISLAEGHLGGAYERTDHHHCR